MNAQVIHVKMEAPVRMKSTAITVNVPLATQDVCAMKVSVIYMLFMNHLCQNLICNISYIFKESFISI